MKTVSNILLVLFVISVAAAGVLVGGDLRDAARLRSSIQEKEQELEQTRAELSEVRTKQRGLQNSDPDVPDSLRVQLRGESFRKSLEYRKRMNAYKWQESDQSRRLRKYQRAQAAIYARVKSRLIVFGGAALLFLAGALITRRAAIRS